MNGTLATAWQDTYRSVLDAEGEGITYVQQGVQGTSVALPAIAQRPEYLAFEVGGQPRVEYDNLEWIVAAVDLAVQGQPIEPADGDRVLRTNPISREMETYEVLPVPGQQAWRRVDPFGYYLAIHTKLVAPTGS